MSIKFLPPRIAKTLDKVLQKKLTIIEAGAGYGKTTLVSQWIEERRIPSLWHTFELALHRPSLRWTDVNQRNLDQLVMHLTEMALTINGKFGSNQFLVVLDNWHAVADDRAISDIIDALVRDTPPHIHLILCTRVTPLLPSLTRLQTEDAVLRIDEDVLAFKLEEISTFIARAFGVILPLEHIEWLQRETEGWPPALHWAGKTISSNSLRWNPEEITKVLREKVFPYFQAELFENLPAEQQESLLTLAVPAEISGEIFGPLLGLDKYLKNLQWATRNHMFLSNIGTDNWRYHRLFHCFLRSQVEQNYQLYRDLTLNIGSLYLSLGRQIEAIPYFVTVAAYPKAGQILEKLMPELQKDNQLETMEKLLSLFPSKTDKYLPNALLAFGEELARVGRGYDALSWMRRASLGFGQLGDDLGITRSLCLMGTVYAAMGLTEEAAAIYQQAKQELPGDEKNRAVILTYITRYQQLLTHSQGNASVPKLRLQCFGSFELSRGKHRLNYNKWRRKALLVLKYLTIQPTHRATKEQLLDLFWPNESPEKASNSYYVTLHSLRQGLTAGLTEAINYLKVERGAVALVPELLAWVDVEEFTYLIHEGHRLWPINPAQAVQCFQSASSLYQRDLLDEDLYEEWLFPLRDQLRNQYLESLTYRAEHAAAQGEPENALKLWNEVIHHDATNERAVREAMRLMSLLCRRSEALQCYQRLCHLLSEELNTDPEPETQKLYHHTLFEDT